MPLADEPTATVYIVSALIAGLPIAWFAWRYVKAWRAPKQPRDRMDWIRAMDPNHEALPTPARQAPMLPTRGLTWGRLLIYAAQAVAVCWLTWVFIGGTEPGGITAESAKGAMIVPVVAVIFVALATALLTAASDWLSHLLRRADGDPKGIRLSATSPVSRVEATDAQLGQPTDKSDGGSAGLRRRELGKPPTPLR